jgi:hypothetical protein
VISSTDSAPEYADDGAALDPSEEPRMLVHTLELADKRQFARAFEALFGAEGVSDCAIELDELRIRFAADETQAARVIRALACDGGLRSAAREWIDTGLVRASPTAVHGKAR